MARPSSFNEKIANKIIELAGDGKTFEQIAEIIGVHVNTLRIWRGKHPEFQWALKEAAQVADDLVEASLFRRACGYSHPAVKIFCTKDGDIIEHQYVEHYPPDTAAAIIWLKNRRPDQWREKPTEEDPAAQVDQAKKEIIKKVIG